MALENRVALGAAANDVRLGHGIGGDVKGFSRTIEIEEAANQNSTYVIGYVPASARIFGISRVSWDDLASTGSPTIRVGLFGEGGNVADDDDALTDSLDVATAAGSAGLIKDIANYGKKAWQLVSGQTAEPKRWLKIVATVNAAAVNTGGTLTVEVFFGLA